ncbi:MAG TPA: MFS transporter [Alphaproteobacteria bacterium]|nr:MFS transporter [Alphaproteobacteria bacterium]
MFSDTARRNVILLALCQGLLGIGTTTMIAEAALVGHMLAADKAYATLPLAGQQLAVMVTIVPASLLMARIGRRAGFTIGGFFGVLGAAIATLGVLWGSFPLFCLGTSLNGIYIGFSMFFRFAAVDGAGKEWHSRAISYVLAGGVLAALLGPELAKHTKDLLAPVTFAGSFAALIAVALLSVVLLQFTRIPTPTEAERREAQRPLSVIARQPAFIVAVLGGMVAYGAMNFVMTATPLAMAACGYPFDDTASVIKWHVFAMFAPSFFTGHVIKRFGTPQVMMVGAAIMAACVAINLAGITYLHFWAALTLLGLGWNFLFVGATTLLTTTYRPAEKAKVQALNDLLVFGTVAATAFSAGVAHHTVGWEVINSGTGPFLILAALATAWLARRRPVAAT